MRKICFVAIATLLLAQASWSDDAVRRPAAVANSAQTIETLSRQLPSLGDAETRARATGELGIALLQARRYDQAEPALREALAFFAGRVEQARYAVHLGHLALARQQTSEAARMFGLALSTASPEADVGFAAELGLARLAAPKERLARLLRLSERLTGEPATNPRQHLALGQQARRLGVEGAAIAWRHLDAARRLAERQAQPRLQAEALDALAQLYEDQSRADEALRLTRVALGLVRALPSGEAADLLIAQEWRQGRLHRHAGRLAQARAAFQRAVEQVEAVRQDLPIADEEGRSTYLNMLEPIYLGYLDLLLTAESGGGGVNLQRAVETVELIRQAEMQDFLGDRCSVEAVQGGAAGLPAGHAVLYPLILPDRLELLLVTPAGIVRYSQRQAAVAVRDAAQTLAEALRNGTAGYLEPARQLHAWLLAPIAGELEKAAVRQLIVVPDGPLRLVPMAALHDGRRFAIEKMAISMATGMSMTHATPMPPGRPRALVAGISMPGGVVEKMATRSLERVVASGSGASRGFAQSLPTRSLRGAATVGTAAADSERSRALDALRASLALPGVKEEVSVLQRILPGTTLLDDQFTVNQFHDQTGRGEYRIVHIASHGLFGGSAETSFIMAYDDVLSMNSLESLLRSDRLRARPVELLGLSACQTAEGNDRAPLGFAGAAIKARARAVLGTLWPVEDGAAKAAMQHFYTALVGGSSKSDALREAQLAILAKPETAHPFFWAPFVLIGNWQ